VFLPCVHMFDTIVFLFLFWSLQNLDRPTLNPPIDIFLLKKGEDGVFGDGFNLIWFKSKEREKRRRKEEVGLVLFLFLFLSGWLLYMWFWSWMLMVSLSINGWKRRSQRRLTKRREWLALGNCQLEGKIIVNGTGKKVRWVMMGKGRRKRILMQF